MPASPIIPLVGGIRSLVASFASHGHWRHAAALAAWGSIASDRAIRRAVHATEFLMKGIDIGGLLLMRSDQSFQVWTGLCLHVLPHKDGTCLTPTALYFESRTNDREADLWLVDICDCVCVGLLELAHKLLRVASGCSGITSCVEVEPLLENSRAVAFRKTFNGDSQDAEAASSFGGEDRLWALVDGHAEHCRDANFNTECLGTSNDLVEAPPLETLQK